jgi:glutathione reductase (NADPH)
MRDWFSSRSYAETVAWSKVIVDRATDRILGAHFVGHAGQELINVFTLAIKVGITAKQLRDNVYAYPTFSADIKHMLGTHSGSLSFRKTHGISRNAQLRRS